MTRSGDYDNEMRAFRPGLDDEAIEQLLEGTPPEERSGLPDVIEAMRTHATHTPPRPSPELAALLSDGLTTDKGELPTRAARNATLAPTGRLLPRWNRGRRLILKAALAKLAALGLVAKAGVASAAVLAATTGAGAAGVLPSPMQEAVADAVGAVTPFELPSDVRDAQPADHVGDDVGDDAGEDVETNDDSADFGERVADDAKGEDGERGVDGSEVADEASDGRSSDLPDEAEEGRENADDASSKADDAGENANDGLTEAEENAPDEADMYIPDEVPADSDQGQDASDGAAPSEAPATSEEGQESGDPGAPADAPTDSARADEEDDDNPAPIDVPGQDGTATDTAGTLAGAGR